MTIKEATKLTGGLSNPSKMPGYGYSVSKDTCPVIAKHSDCDSICSKCYAKKGRYNFPKVQAAMKLRAQKRMFSLEWQKGMEHLISKRCTGWYGNVPYFRWHDCGDIEYVEDLLSIMSIAKNLPKVHFWLPTKRYELVEMIDKKDVPKNLTIRLSAHYIDRKPMYDCAIGSQDGTSFKVEDPGKLKKYPFSTVIKEISYKDARICPATNGQKGCQECRKCWDSKVKHISYKIH